MIKNTLWNLLNNNYVKKRQIFAGIILLLLLSAITIWYFVWQAQTPFLKVVFCDVGQGNASLVHTKDDFDLLIDGGPDDSVLSCLGNNLGFFNRKIEAVILTHPDADHLAGLIAVLKRYQVDKIYSNGEKKDTAIYQEWEKLINDYHLSAQIISAPEQIIFNEKIFLRVLNPPNDNSIFNKANTKSIVAQLIFDKEKFIFTGDIESAESDWLAAQNTDLDLKSAVFLVPHHGSKNGLTKKLLEKVNPSLAIISVGANNRYNHPHQEILDLLKNYQLLRTDLVGTITITSDGEQFWVKKKNKQF